MSIQLLPSSRTTAIATVNEIVPYRYIMTTTPGQTVQLRDIDVLARSNCKIKDPQRVERIINDIISGGNSELQVVTDFDFTLTKQKTDEGKPVLSSFGMFNKCKSLPKSFLDESKKLYQKYRPLEICPKITQDEKRKHMENWWQMSDELLKGFAFDPNEIDELAKQYSHALRDGTHDLFQRTHEMNVPVLVFSAGLGDSIKAVLKHEQILLSNVKLVSNFLKYKNGMVDGFSEEFPLIHTFNKNETVLEGTEYYDMVHNRQHVILMGDSLADADMAEGVPKTSSILKIGFLFDHPEKNLPKYMDRFDIVLIDDQTMDIPRKILSLVKQQNPSTK